jgi:hypothetical protein
MSIHNELNQCLQPTIFGEEPLEPNFDRAQVGLTGLADFG